MSIINYSRKRMMVAYNNQKVIKIFEEKGFKLFDSDIM
jgi:hypothetical protein